MTRVTTDEVRHLAQLSSLTLSDEEIGALEKDITTILSYVEQLNELETEHIEPAYQVTTLENVWREDEVIDDGITREQLISLASDAKNNQIKVPKVL